MSVLMEMLAHNMPLYQWREYERETKKAAVYRAGGSVLGCWNEKKLDSIANRIVSACSHPDVVALVAQEWEIISGLLRQRITQLANGRRESGAVSGNASKGISRLNEMLGGKILSRTREVETVRGYSERNGRLAVVDRRVNRIAASAERAFAAYAMPPGYDKWLPAQKKRWRKQAARDRRRDRSSA